MTGVGTFQSAAVLLAVGLATVGTVAAPAGAEVERPPQLDAARAVGLAYTRIPPPALQRACLVDSGVSTNADTKRVVAKLAVDGGAGEDGDLASAHGTSMAMYMAAERNGEGMVGIWPAGEVVSYRVTRDGRDLSFGDYVKAISACAELDRVGVISLALVDASAGTEEEKLRLDDVISDARQQGAVVVAAAGNGGGPVGSPGRHAGVLTVAAADPSGSYCSFASRGPEVELLAPGCGLEGASPFDLEPSSAEGSSHATAMAAQAIAALRSYRPTFSVSDVEAALARMGPVLDVERLFRTEGLASVVENGLALAPSKREVSPGPLSRLPRPSLMSFRANRRCVEEREFVRRRCRSARRRYALRNGRLSVKVRARPANALLEVRIYTRRSGTYRSTLAVRVRRASRLVSMRSPRGWRRLAVRFVPKPGAMVLHSEAVVIRRE